MAIQINKKECHVNGLLKDKCKVNNYHNNVTIDYVERLYPS